jgi:hypothetical protein
MHGIMLPAASLGMLPGLQTPCLQLHSRFVCLNHLFQSLSAVAHVIKPGAGGRLVKHERHCHEVAWLVPMAMYRLPREVLSPS